MEYSVYGWNACRDRQFCSNYAVCNVEDQINLRDYKHILQISGAKEDKGVHFGEFYYGGEFDNSNNGRNLGEINKRASCSA